MTEGFGNHIASCREYTSLVQILNQNFGWCTEIDPVLEVKVICHHSVCGIEIQISSTSGDDTNVWVVISRSSNRCVDELRYRESQISLEEVAQECMQDQDEERSQGERSDDRIPIHKRVWEDLTANEFSYGYRSETQVSKFVSNSVRHENSRERETDGVIHGKVMSPKLRFQFQSDGGSNFSDRDGINFIGKEANKTRFQYCQNSCNKLLYIRAIQGHTGREMIQPEMLGHVLRPPNWKEFVFHGGCSVNLTFILNAGFIVAGQEGHFSTHEYRRRTKIL